MKRKKNMNGERNSVVDTSEFPDEPQYFDGSYGERQHELENQVIAVSNTGKKRVFSVSVRNQIQELCRFLSCGGDEQTYATGSYWCDNEFTYETVVLYSYRLEIDATDKQIREHLNYFKRKGTLESTKRNVYSASAWMKQPLPNSLNEKIKSLK